MAKMGMLALTAFLACGFGQEAIGVNFDMNVYHSQPIRLDVVLFAYAAWKWVGWVARREAEFAGDDSAGSAIMTCTGTQIDRARLVQLWIG